MILNQIHGWFSVQMLLAFFHSNPSKKFHLSCLVQSSSILGISNPVKPKHKQIISGWKARGAQHDCKCRSPVGSLQAHTRFAFCSSHQLQCSRGIGSAVSGEPWGHGTEGTSWGPCYMDKASYPVLAHLLYFPGGNGTVLLLLLQAPRILQPPSRCHQPHHGAITPYQASLARPRCLHGPALSRAPGTGLGLLHQETPKPKAFAQPLWGSTVYSDSPCASNHPMQRCSWGNELEDQHSQTHPTETW